MRRFLLRGLVLAIALSSGPAWAKKKHKGDPASPEAAAASAAGSADPEQQQPSVDAEGAESSDGGKASSADDDDAVEEPKVKVFGRVFALATADQRQDFARDMGIADARLGVKATYGFADAVVQADLSASSMLKDAYLRLRAGDSFRIYGGQFKAPFSLRELTSSWDLERVGRGLVSDFLVGEQHLGGRRIGAMVEARSGWMHGVTASAGVFQGEKDLDGQHTGEDGSLRLTARPIKAITFGASGYFADVAGGAKRFGAGGDATLHFHRAALGVEALAGRLPTSHFTSQTALLSYDLPFGKTGRWLLQPMVTAEGLQLRGEEAGFGWGGGVGLNAILDGRFKLMVQGERAQRPGDMRPANDVALQLGARF